VAEIVVVQAFKTSDGRVFETMPEAERHEALAELGAVMERGRVGRGGEWDAGMFQDFLVDRAAELAPILTKLAAPSR